MTTGNKIIMWKRGEIAPKEQFLLFSILFYIYIYITSGVKLHIHLLSVFVQFIVFLTLSTLICRGTDISKCFSESLGIRDNESRLYFSMITYVVVLIRSASDQFHFPVVEFTAFRLSLGKLQRLIRLHRCSWRPWSSLFAYA